MRLRPSLSEDLRGARAATEWQDHIIKQHGIRERASPRRSSGGFWFCVWASERGGYSVLPTVPPRDDLAFFARHS
jgi:hypothetical protein